MHIHIIDSLCSTAELTQHGNATILQQRLKKIKGMSSGVRLTQSLSTLSDHLTGQWWNQMTNSGEARCLAKRKCSINVSSFLFLLMSTCQSHIRTGNRKGLGIEKTCVQILALLFTGNEILVKLLHLCKPQFHHVSYINSNGNAHFVQLEGLSEKMTV